MANNLEAELADQIALCYNDPLRFVDLVFPWGEKGTPLEKFPDGPDKWHRELFKELTEHINENIRRRAKGLQNKPFKGSVKSGHGIGKAHPLDMIVPTPTGYRKWGELKPGDKLFHPDGFHTTITECHYYDNLVTWRVNLSDGTSVECSEGHLWNVYRNEAYIGERTKCVLETIDLYELYKKPNRKKVYLQEIQPVEYVEREKPAVEPYFMGLWLSKGLEDGSVRNISKWSKHHLKSLNFEGYSPECYSTFGLSVGERHIPADYLFGSIETRAELARGLMDAGGHPYPTWAGARFITASRQLAEDAAQLFRSLGVKAIVADNRNDTCIDVKLSFDDNFHYFHDKDKLAKMKFDATHASRRRTIDSVEKVKTTHCKRTNQRKNMMCVTVDAPDALYLTKDFVPTHNSAGVAWIILWLMSTRHMCKGVVTANTEVQLKTKTWMELAKWHDMALNKHWFELKGTQIFSTTNKDWRFDCIPWSENNTEAFAGLHNAGSSAVVIFDEASGIPDKIWEVAEGSQTDGEPFWFAFGNPTQNSGRFYECWNKFRKRWKGITVDSREVRISNKELIQEWADDYGDDSDFFKVRVLGEFPSAGDKQFISTGKVVQAMERTNEGDTPVIIGVDIARYGDDETVIVVREGRKIDKSLIFRYKGADLMQTVGNITEKIEKYNPEAVFVDDGGLGGGVVDRLKQLGYNVYGINFANRANDEQKYGNKRAEMWGNMKEWVEIGDLPNSDDIRADLTAPEYKFDAKNRLLLESKDDMKKRGLRSPDIGDAIALTFAMKVASRDINKANMRRRMRTFADSDYDIFGGVV